MKNRLVVLVWLAYMIAWALPVIKEGVTLPDGLPGWQAFRVAASPVWPYEGSTTDWPWYWKVLSVLSAATNLVMLVSIPVAVQRVSPLTRVIACLSGLAFLINAQWCVHAQLAELRIGYFLWWLSFLALTIGLFYVRGADPVARVQRRKDAA